VHHTRGGRLVYGGGGIMPDVFVPMDTTRASNFFIACNRKATQMRYASHIFDRHAARLSAIETYREMDAFLSSLNLEVDFPAYARKMDDIPCTEAEWDRTEAYLLPQLRALIARYSKLGENAFYKYYLPVDYTVEKALEAL
jgi:carboxyl-terminal processing protease